MSAFSCGLSTATALFCLALGHPWLAAINAGFALLNGLILLRRAA